MERHYLMRECTIGECRPKRYSGTRKILVWFMRDALSILDQAIASSSGKLTAESVRNLVGAAPAHILEQVMQAVSESKSEEILRQVDHLISEGHSPTHFARQMVRFLRNATVAKIAGRDSALLQISNEERERVARVAELFGEEDLTRHLQIMCSK